MSRLYLIKSHVLWAFISFLCLSSVVNGQVFNLFDAMRGSRGVGTGLSVSGGYTTLFQNRNTRPFHGAHLQLGITETPIFFRITYLPRQTNEIEARMLTAVATDVNKIPQTLQIPYKYKESMNYITIDFFCLKGHFINEEIDDGFSMYAGFISGIGINAVKKQHIVNEYNMDDYNITDTLVSGSFTTKKTYFNLNAGALLGGQYRFKNGTALYFDFQASVFRFWRNNEDTTTMIKRPWGFACNFGYKIYF